MHVQAQVLAAGGGGERLHPLISSLRRRYRAALPGGDEETLSARILDQEHLAYTEAGRLVLTGQVRLEGDRVVREESG
ncbi:MAG: hypothetical protein GY856_51695 [bacterium]|nr:hypothetical protein [bacterium]